jgi:hypothetical protein
MKRVIALAIGVLATSSMAMADYDRANCYTNDAMASAELECVTCGVQRFMDKKGNGKYPSERWIALLATTNRAYMDSNGQSIVSSVDTRQRMQKTLAMQLQSFGFCTKFDGSRGKNKPDDGYIDMSPNQWSMLNKLLRDATPATGDEMEDFAKGYGFDSNSKGKAAANLKILLYDDKSQSGDRGAHLLNLQAWQKKPLFQRRAEFRDRLEKALNKDSVVTDANLRGCLENVLQGLEGRGAGSSFQADPDAFGLCQEIHKSCEIEGNDNYCYAPGMQLSKPVAAPAPRPQSTVPAKPGSAGGTPSTLPAPPPLPDPGFQQR